MAVSNCAGLKTLDGVPVNQLANDDLRRHVVMVTQESFLFSGTVAENIGLGSPGASIEEIVLAARAVGAHEFIQALPDGYATDVNKRGGRVSAGQRPPSSACHRPLRCRPSAVIRPLSSEHSTTSLPSP